MKPIKLFLLIAVSSILISACTGVAIVPIENTAQSVTPIVNTPIPLVTSGPTSTNVVALTLVPATATEAASQTGRCLDSAEFVADISVPDGTVLESSSSFAKTWRVKNSGTCTWDSRYSLVFTDGTLMMPVDRVPLTVTVAPGKTVDLSLDMTSPIYPGAYESDWKLQSPDGTRFGVGNKNSPLWVKLVIGSPKQTTITGITFQDINGDALVDSNDVLMANREVWLQKGGCDMGGERIAVAVSGSDGRFVLSGMFSGTYCLGLKGQDGMEDVATLTVEPGQTLSNWNLRASIPNAVISGMVWSDMQSDGIWQSIEPHISGLTVILQTGPCANPISQVPVSTTTDANGLFSFGSLYGSTYCISIRAGEGGNVNLLGSGMWTTPIDGIQQITVRPGESKSVNFGWQFK